MPTLGQTWREVQQRLEAAGLNPAPREGQQLVAQAYGCERTQLHFHEHDVLSEAQKAQLETWLEQRLMGEPLAYVLGVQPFWAHDWQVAKGVLIPRPDSEVLVQAVLETLPRSATSRIAEVGVGSGALLGSILLERQNVQGVGTDISPDALAIATQNMATYGLTERVALVQTSVLEGIEGSFEIIFSNPPYISEADYAMLENGVRDYEPRMALVGEGPTGTAFYTVLVKQALPMLVRGGMLAVEIGHTQGTEVAAMFTAAGLQDVEVINDLAGRPRVVKGIYS